MRRTDERIWNDPSLGCSITASAPHRLRGQTVGPPGFGHFAGDAAVSQQFAIDGVPRRISSLECITTAAASSTFQGR
jgi:hypothetical protein